MQKMETVLQGCCAERQNQSRTLTRSELKNTMEPQVTATRGQIWTIRIPFLKEKQEMESSLVNMFISSDSFCLLYLFIIYTFSLLQLIQEAKRRGVTGWTNSKRFIKLLLLESFIAHKNKLSAVLQLEDAPALMPLNKLTRCYWNLSLKCYSQDSRLTSSELRKPFYWTGIQTLGRWEQVGLDGIVCCLSNCYTPLCSERLLYLWGLHRGAEGREKK